GWPSERPASRPRTRPGVDFATPFTLPSPRANWTVLACQLPKRKLLALLVPELSIGIGKLGPASRPDGWMMAAAEMVKSCLPSPSVSTCMYFSPNRKVLLVPSVMSVIFSPHWPGLVPVLLIGKGPSPPTGLVAFGSELVPALAA